jgi:adenylate cyclase
VTATGVACASCGAEASRAGARFCDACGATLAASDAHAEFKQVTVLFADVVRSMELAAALGAERLREIMTGLVESFAVVVHRYGGTLDKFTGDGIMAIFGAPIALEDHAIRACWAAQDIQKETERLAAEVERRDGATLKLRIGLNSGEVIVGETGSGSMGYTAIGDQVGMAQRMESVARPGAVMLSESTARLTEHIAEIGDPQLVQIKGFDAPVVARQLLRVNAVHDLGRRSLTSLVGRRWEMSAVEAVLARSVDGRGSVICVGGPSGIGKSRIVIEAAAMAAKRGVGVYSTFCESHATEVPFHAVARLLRAVFRIDELPDDSEARVELRSQIVGAATEDLLLLDDMLGIRDPDTSPPEIAPEARKRRLTALVNSAYLARSTPAVYVIEDAHWIDQASESLLAELLSVVAQTNSLVVITYRPEYRGELSQVSGAQTITLAPLDDSESATLVSELLGGDPSAAALTVQIAERAAGNPFFAQELVRDLADRRVLLGRSGDYRCPDPTAEVSVPATLHAAIAARIDRLDGLAKQTLNAAAVIGMRFSAELPAALIGETALTELVKAELIDQVRFTPRAEYAFHHQMVRTVAYESQLKADRSALHHRLATALQDGDPGSADENAVLIAEHLEAAGDLVGAYGWHMRAGAWFTIRDISAADASWRKAQQVADRLPADCPDRMSMRIAPRTFLAGSAWRVEGSGAQPNFDELRDLCEAAGDKRSLAIGMTGLVMKSALNSQYAEASRLASEHIRLLDAIDDEDLIVALSFAPSAAKYGAGEPEEALRLAQRVIDLADGDPTKGSLFFGSPLTLSIMLRGCIRCGLGIPAWRADFDDALAKARDSDIMTRAIVVFYICVIGIPYGTLQSGAGLLTETAETLALAERSGDETTLSAARCARGLALADREGPDREAGLALLAQVREETLRERFSRPVLAFVAIELARAKAMSGDLDEAIELARPYARPDQDEIAVYGLAVCVLVESLLRRGGDAATSEAEHTIRDFVTFSTGSDYVVFNVMALRLRALLARAQGDEAGFREFLDRCRAMAESVGYDGHITMAAAM